MLEAMRRNSRGTIIYVLFGILIAVFIINFGPGSRGCSGAIANSFAARVGNVDVSEAEFRLYYIAKVGNRFDSRIAKQYKMKEILMDKVIERELLAQEAEKLGFRVSDKEAEDLIKTGKMMLLAREEPWGDVSEGFDYKRFHTVVENSLGVSVQKFIEIQRRELLADKMRQLMAGSIKVSPAEAEEAYNAREQQTNLEFVRFAPSQFEGNVPTDAAAVDAYVKAHGDDLKKMYEERAFLFRKLEKQARARRILVAVAKDEPDAAAVGRADKKAARLRALLADPTKKADFFGALAHDASDDETSKQKAGDLGWHKKGYFGLGDEIEGKIFGAKEGEVIGPIRSDKGFEILRVEGFREGDVPFEKVASDLAEEKLRTDQAKGQAKVAADDAVAKARTGQKLAALYPKPAEGDDSDAAKLKKTAPHVEETGAFPHRGDLVAQIGNSKEIMAKAFQLKEGEVAGPFEVANTWVVVQVKDRKEPDKDYFTKHQDEEVRQIERMKWADVVDSWAKQRCSEEASNGSQALQSGKKGKIRWNPEALSYEAANDTNYEPCVGNRLQL